jgi:hypothetical protein
MHVVIFDRKTLQFRRGMESLTCKFPQQMQKIVRQMEEMQRHGKGGFPGM